jgi:hypothetical protein
MKSFTPLCEINRSTYSFYSNLIDQVNDVGRKFRRKMKRKRKKKLSRFGERRFLNKNTSFIKNINDTQCSNVLQLSLIGFASLLFSPKKYPNDS